MNYDKKRYEGLMTTVFKFGSVGGDIYSEELKFWVDGTISGYHDDNEFRWELNDKDELIIYSKQGKISHVFELDNDVSGKWSGQYLLSKKVRRDYLIPQPANYELSDNSPSRKLMPFQKIGRHVYGKIEFLSTPYSEAKDFLEIGNFVSIGPQVKMVVRNHDYQQVSTYNFMSNRTDFTWKYYGHDPNQDHVYSSKTVIGSDVWIGANATLIGGITVGHGAVIGTESVVTKDVPPYAIVAGNPAKVVRMRFNEQQVKELLAIAWWNWSDDKINRDLISFNDSDAVDSFIEKYSVVKNKKQYDKWLINMVYSNQLNALNPANLAIQKFAKQAGYTVIVYPEIASFNSDTAMIKDGDVVMVAYPTFYKTVQTKLKYEDDLLKQLRDLNVKIIGLVGDSMLLREAVDYIDNEINILNMFDVLVVPNTRMQREFENSGVTTPAIIQGLYPIANVPKLTNKGNLNKVNLLYAGNLNKAEFLNTINLSENYRIELFGPNVTPSMLANESLNYHGALKFDELNHVLDEFDGFGIAWDGPDIPIKTKEGRYTRFNYPYKISQYIARGIPLIVWSGSASAEYVLDHNLGIVLTDIKQLEMKLAQLSLDELTRMKENVYREGLRLISGDYFVNTIREAEKLLLLNE